MAMSASGVQAAPLVLPRTWTGRCAHALGQFLVVVATLSGIGIGAWWFVDQRVDHQLAREIEAKLAERLGSDSEITIKVGDARRIEGRGIELRKVTIGAKSGSTPWAEIDEVWLSCNAELQDLLNGHLHVRHVTARHVHVHVAIGRDGRWNLPGFRLRDSVSSGEPTTISLEDGTLEITDARRPNGRPLVLRGIELDLKRPTSETLEAFDWSPPVPWHVRGRCVADPLESCAIEALFDGSTGESMTKGTVRDLRFSHEFVETLPHEISDLLVLTAPLRGHMRGEFAVEHRSREPGTPASLAYTVEGELTEGRIDDARLDGALTGVRAKFKCDRQGLVIEEASARSGQAVLYGWLKCQGYAADSPLSFEVRARKFRIGRHLVELAPLNWQVMLRQFAVEGTVNADIKANFDGKTWNPQVTVQCLDLDLEYSKFPYRLSGGTGYLEYKHGALKSTHLKGLAEGQLVRVEIQLENLGPDYTGVVEVVTDTPVSVDEKLLSALNDDCERLARALHARGAVTVHARIERPSPDQPMQWRARVGVHQAAIQYVNFPYPIERIRGTIVVTDAGWNIEELSGENNTAYIECRGGWTSTGNHDGELLLNFLATDVPLDDELQNALPPSGQKWWTHLRPRGTLDHLVVSVRLPPGAAYPQVEATAEKRSARQNVDGRSITVKPALFPFQIDNVTGIVRYREGEYTIEQLRGEHGRGVLQATGACVVQRDGAWRLRLANVSVDRFLLDHDLLAALPNETGHSLARLQISGPIRGQGLIDIEGSTQLAGQTRGTWDVTVDIENGGLNGGVPLEQIRGEIRLLGQFSPQGIVSRGELIVDSLLCRGIQLAGIRGPISFTNRQVVLGNAWAPPNVRAGPVRPITAQVFGGTLVADAIISLGDDIGFRTEALLNDADLAMLAREALSRRRDILGKASAAIRLEGNSRGTHTLRGEGWLKCRDADIDQLPVTGAMLKQIGARNGPARALSLSDVDFRIQDNCFYFPRIDFKGDGLMLKGNGEMQFNRAVDLKFYTVAGRDEVRLPVLSPVLAEASRQILEIEVTGTLDEPEVRRHVVPVINEALQQMFPELSERPAAERTLLRRLTQPRQAAQPADAVGPR